MLHLFQRVTQNVEKSRVRGIGFDATCSLVVLDQDFQPVPVSQDGKWNVYTQPDLCTLGKRNLHTPNYSTLSVIVGGISCDFIKLIVKFE